MELAEFIASMPKVELHVHIEGSIRPETLLRLAKKNEVSLPATTVEGLREWYRFRDFNHFVEVYVAASSCIRSREDIELVLREFVDGQVEQNILHTEATYTAETIQRYCGIPWSDQLNALRAGREYAESKGVSLGYVIDIVREVEEGVGLQIVDWAIEAEACALGLSGVEADTPAERHREAFRRAKDAGLNITTHAGETSGPQAIWDCLEILGADRIGHGVRCLEDDPLVAELLKRNTHLEVCPSSNVCLCVSPSIESHPLQAMVTRGLNVGVNSDDPPMFNTTLSEEWRRCQKSFDWTKRQMLAMQMQTIDAAFVSEERKTELRALTETYHAR